LLIVSSKNVAAQDKRSKKEEISITSSFKPSIVKTGKLEFQAEAPPKDTTAYKLNYPTVPIQFTTPMSSFVIKPLSFHANEKQQDRQDVYAKLGFGNLSTPFASLGFTSRKSKEQFTANADHISSIGKLEDQLYAHSSLNLGYKNTIAENRIARVYAGYDRQGYRLYGFDHARNTSLPVADLRQNFNNFHLGAKYDHLSGENGSMTLMPEIRADFLTASRAQSEFALTLAFPISYKINETLKAGIAVDAQMASLKKGTQTNQSAALVQVPLSFEYSPSSFNVKGSIIPVLKSNKIKFVPNLQLDYLMGETGLKLKAGVVNKLDINSLHKLYAINPFLISPDSLTIFQQTDYYAGVEWLSPKGLQLKFNGGYTVFNDLPLFLNAEGSGKEMKVLNEAQLKAIHLAGEVNYTFTPEMEFRSSINVYAFQNQATYSAAYGLLPLELKFGLFWKPFKGLTTRVNADLWRGALARSPGMPEKRLKDAADINLGVDYKLNKKWALWVDLNNIANIQYQRWNQYDSFGFNFIAGLRYSFTKAK
jgi:outer membrane receptor protein involved in Fe transport